MSHPAHEDELHQEEGGGGCEVIGLAGIKPQGGVQQTSLCEDLGNQSSGSTEHGPPSVLQLCLNIPLQVGWVGTEAERVKAVVTGKPGRERRIEG